MSFDALCTSVRNTGQEAQCRDEIDQTNNIDVKTNDEKAIKIAKTRFYGGKYYRSSEAALSRAADAGVGDIGAALQ